MKLRERVRLFRASGSWPDITLDEFAQQMDKSIDGQMTRAGTSMSTVDAMGISAFFCGVNLITGWMASCKCILYERIDERSKRRLKGVPLYSVIHDRFSPTLTAYQGWRTMMGHVILWGNAYALKVKDRYRGGLTGLSILHPSQVRAMKVKGSDELQYEVTDDFNQKRILTREDIFHVPGPGFNGLTGFSVLSLARESLGLTAAMEQFGQNYFGQGVHAGGFLERPVEAPKISTEEARKRLVQSISEQYAGLGNQGKFILLDEVQPQHDPAGGRAVPCLAHLPDSGGRALAEPSSAQAEGAIAGDVLEHRAPADREHPGLPAPVGVSGGSGDRAAAHRPRGAGYHVRGVPAGEPAARGHGIAEQCARGAAAVGDHLGERVAGDPEHESPGRGAG
jgi:hypothetical protein